MDERPKKMARMHIPGTIPLNGVQNENRYVDESSTSGAETTYEEEKKYFGENKNAYKTNFSIKFAK